jgi:hypothetical protein
MIASRLAPCKRQHRIAQPSSHLAIELSLCVCSHLPGLVAHAAPLLPPLMLFPSAFPVARYLVALPLVAALIDLGEKLSQVSEWDCPWPLMIQSVAYCHM